MLFLGGLVLALSALPASWATIDNSKEYNIFTNASVKLTAGDYIFTNVGTGNSITTVKNNRQFFAAPGNGSPIRLADAPGGNYERISADTKCLSAQWDANGEGTGVGADAAGVLYTCVFGANAASSSSVGADKQKWLFVPTDYDDDTPTYYNDACCKKTKSFIQRHPEYVKSDNYYHMECASELTQKQRRALNLTDADYEYLAKYKAKCQASLSESDQVTKRAASSGTYYIITLDHLKDQPTRVIGPGNYTKNGADKVSIDLDVFSKGNSDQQWRITKA